MARGTVVSRAVPSTKPLLLGLLGLIAAAFTVYWARAPRVGKDDGAPRWPSPFHVAVGFVTDFLDTLGIGSFATTGALYRLAGRVDDRVVPGTLNVGHALPTVIQALIYITIIEVEMTTLLVLILAAVAGAWLGSGFVANWSRRKVRLAIGSALLVAAVIMVLRAKAVVPGGGEALGLSPARLAVGAAANFVLGALMTAGVGLYGPCMILVSFLGMNQTAAFPIMMGSCAFLMPAASPRFIRRRAFDGRAALGLTLGGMPAVFVAAFVVRALPLDVVRWLVIGVVTIAGVSLLDAARRKAP
jgi:uncharacterized membrane protein YfcA